MSRLRSFVIKEFRHILRDPMTMLIVLCLPIVMLVMFGFALSNEVKNARFAVCAPVNDQATRQAIARLAANDSFVFAGMIGAPQEIEPMFRRGEVSFVVVFGASQIQLIADGSDPNTAQSIVQYATAVLTDGLASPIETRVRLLYNPEMKGAYNFVPGVMGMILLLVCAMMTSISIAREKELGTMEVLLVSPLRPIQIVVGKTLPYFVLSVLDLALILLLSVFVLGVPIAGSLFWLMVLSALYIFLALALGLLISTLVHSQVVALLISGMAMMMPTLMLSGMMFPIENMPWPLKVISQIIPAKWFIAATKKVMIKGLGVSAIGQELAILGGMMLVLVLLALKKQKVRLDS